MQRWVVVVALVGLACGGGDKTGGGGGVPTEAELSLACVRSAACGFLYPPYCARNLEPSQYACLVAAGADCDAVFSCYGFTRTVDPACESRCEGSTAVACLDGLRLERDCDADPFPDEAICTTRGGGPFCSAGECHIEDDPGVCVGTVIKRCSTNNNFTSHYELCEPHGWSCTADDGRARCTDGTSIPCDQGSSRCEGDVLVLCPDHFELRQACSSSVSDATCQAAFGQAWCGTGTECDPNADDAGICVSDTELSYCHSGTLRTYDCVELGYTRCVDKRCVP